MSYKDNIAWLYGLQKFGIKLGLSNITNLLNLLNNPEENLKTIHIAGTNGKGSTAAFLSSVLSKAGYRVGVFTSPHLISFTERIRIGEEEISQEKVAELIATIRKKIKQAVEIEKKTGFNKEEEKSCQSLEKVTFFEFVTALALYYFAQKTVDLAILEVGMGGRLDATNVIHPLLTIITNIGLEHQQYLGKTIPEIAGEKAGIIKNGVPLITAAKQKKVLDVLKEECRKHRNFFYQIGKDVTGVTLNHQTFNYHGKKKEYLHLEPGLKGDFQITNATIALAAIEILEEAGYPASVGAVYRGIKEVKWPGRLEIVNRKPKVILDGAHNAAAAKVLSGEIKKNFFYRKLFLILGVMADKNIKSIVDKLVSLAHHVILTQPVIDRSASPEILYKHVKKFRKPTKLIAGIQEAIEYTLSSAGNGDLILITGSLFTIGEAKQFFNQRR